MESGACSSRWVSAIRRYTPLIKKFAVVVFLDSDCRFRFRTDRRPGRDSRQVNMELKSRIPSGPIENRWDRHRFEMKLVNPANKRKYNDHSRRNRTGRRFGLGVAWRTWVQRQMLLLSGQSPARPQHCCARRNQRGEELSERRRQHLSAVLRHGQRRRLPRDANRTFTDWRRSA